MRKEIKYKLSYVEDNGIQKELEINISFVPNIAIKKYNEIISTVHEVMKTWDDMNYLIADMAALDKEKPDGWKQQKLNKEIEYVTKANEIRLKGDQYFFDKRLELIFLLLKKNGIQDEKFFDPSFWDNNVDPSDILDFITAAIYKDENKKKLH